MDILREGSVKGYEKRYGKGGEWEERKHFDKPFPGALPLVFPRAFLH
jgi:hypothetical protein